MCGRTRVTCNQEQISSSAFARVQRWNERQRYCPSYNVSPGCDTPVIQITEASEAILRTMRWGLVPSFTKGSEGYDHFRMMNARSETAAEKPVFKRLLGRGRCLIPINGFYEWRKEAGRAQPYYVHAGEGAVLFLAGLCDAWTDPSTGAELLTYTILTTESSEALKWLHDRMPVILGSHESQRRWLGLEPGDPLEVCSPYSGPEIAWHAVTPAMSKPSYQREDACRALKRASIRSFLSKMPGPGGAGAEPRARDPRPLTIRGAGPTPEPAAGSRGAPAAEDEEGEDGSRRTAGPAEAAKRRPGAEPEAGERHPTEPRIRPEDRLQDGKRMKVSPRQAVRGTAKPDRKQRQILGFLKRGP
mmetsp:Transcript_39325/g.93191  ORF Transcript_39325/g.93191 Transcript_39325/m.93191 type:complete len:359 (+) Transcript_39325:84-1160(+)